VVNTHWSRKVEIIIVSIFSTVFVTRIYTCDVLYEDGVDLTVVTIRNFITLFTACN